MLLAFSSIDERLLLTVHGLTKLSFYPDPYVPSSLGDQEIVLLLGDHVSQLQIFAAIMQIFAAN